MSDEPTAEDDFGKFFDNLSALATEKKSIPANFGASDVVQPAADPVVAAVPADAGAVAEATPVVDAEVVGESSPPVPAPARSDDAAALNRLADLLDRRAPPAPAYQPQPTPAPRLYTDAEIAKIEALQKDYPDVAEGIQLLMRGTTVQNNAYLMQRINERVAPTEEAVQAVGTNYHVDTLHRVIPDYDQIYDPVTQWVTTDRSIPPPLRAAYRGVMESGEVSDVKWLTDEWRKATGNALKSAPPGSQAKPGNELSEAAKQAAVALAPVVSRATAVVTSADPVTFDDAWSKWSAPAKA